MVDTMGYSRFFLMTAVMGIPVVILILVAMRVLTLKVPR